MAIPPLDGTFLQTGHARYKECQGRRLEVHTPYLAVDRNGTHMTQLASCTYHGCSLLDCSANLSYDQSITRNHVDGSCCWGCCCDRSYMESIPLATTRRHPYESEASPRVLPPWTTSALSPDVFLLSPSSSSSFSLMSDCVRQCHGVASRVFGPES